MRLVLGDTKGGRFRFIVIAAAALCVCCCCCWCGWCGCCCRRWNEWLSGVSCGRSRRMSEAREVEWEECCCCCESSSDERGAEREKVRVEVCGGYRDKSEARAGGEVTSVCVCVCILLLS